MGYSYKRLSFVQAHPPATAEQIAAIEKVLGVTLPEDYRDFLRHVNGCVIKPPIFVEYSKGGADETKSDNTIGRFFSVDPDHHDYIVHELMCYDIGTRIPDKVVPIAVALTDNACCISLRERDYGHVYIWEPENPWAQNEDYPIEKSDKDLYLVANSFEELLAFAGK